MVVIRKYELKITAEQEIKLQVGYKILAVQNQNGKLTMWVKVNPNNEQQHVRFFVVGTGNLINPDYLLQYQDHIGTVQIDGMVWHVFVE